MSVLPFRKDAHVLAPPAIWYGHRNDQIEALPDATPQDIIDLQKYKIMHLESELGQLRATANTIANTAACLAYLAQQAHPDQEWVTVPRDVREKFQHDVKLSVRSTEEGTQVRWITRGPDHQFEGRADG